MGDDASHDSHGFGWTPAQRRALIFLVAALFLWLCFRVVMNRQYVPDPQPTEGLRARELASRIDPNSADWQTLAAIPTLGEKRAKAIVAYREHVLAQDEHRMAFSTPADLLHVRGIGQATMENLRPYLIFPNEMTATGP